MRSPNLRPARNEKPFVSGLRQYPFLGFRLLCVLVVTSMLLPNLSAAIPAMAAGSLGPDLLVTPAPEEDESGELENTEFPQVIETPPTDETAPPEIPPAVAPPESVEVIVPEPSIPILLEGRPFFITPGGEVQIAWQVTELGNPISGAEIVFAVPETFKPLSGQIWKLDPEKGEYRFPTNGLSGQTAWRVESGATGPFLIKVQLRQGEQAIAGGELLLEQMGLPSVSDAGGVVEGLGGKVKITFPQDAVGQPVAVRISAPSAANRLPYSLSGRPFEIVAYDLERGDSVRSFPKALTIEVENLFPSDSGYPYLAFYDEPSKSWQRLETTVDPKTGWLVATTDHFTIFDEGIDAWEKGLPPRMDAAQVSGYTGAGSYSVPIWTPPGPGGLQPTLSLSYNSQVVDAALAAHTQASWVGLGWTLETGYIERDMHGTMYETGDDVFNIVAAGVSSRLLKQQGTNPYYRTADESFWRVEYNSTTKVWYAWDGAGNKYTFGSSDASRARYVRFHPSSSAPGDQIPDYWRWMLVSVENKFGKALTYTYSRQTETKSRGGYNYTVDTAIYPYEITYPDSPYKITFERQARYDYDDAWDGNSSRVFYQKERLLRILVKNGTTVIRKYEFAYLQDIFSGYTWSQSPGTWHSFAISSVQEFGLNSTSRSAITFTYADGLHLTGASNGYGGSVTFNYDNTPWYETNNGEAWTFKRDWACTEWEGGHCSSSDPGALTVTGSSTHPTPYYIMRPGGVYLLHVRLRGINGNTTGQIGFKIGDDLNPDKVVKDVSFSSEYTDVSGYLILPDNARGMRL